MLVIYRTNEGFEGDVVTVMTGDADLAAATLGGDVAVLDVPLATADAAALVLAPEKYAVSKGLLCERDGQRDVLAKAREECADAKAVVSDQTSAVVGKLVAEVVEEPARREVIT
jgi:hypothetical protein